MQRAALAAIRPRGWRRPAHDCSDGGLAVALAEMCISGGKGLAAPALELGGRLDAALFGEAQSRVVLAVPPGSGERLQEIAVADDLPLVLIGRVGGDRLRLGPHVDLAVAGLAEAYEGSLEQDLAV